MKVKIRWYADERYGRFDAGVYYHRIDGTDGYGVVYRTTGPTLNGVPIVDDTEVEIEVPDDPAGQVVDEDNLPINTWTVGGFAVHSQSFEMSNGSVSVVVRSDWGDTRVEVQPCTPCSDGAARVPQAELLERLKPTPFTGKVPMPAGYTFGAPVLLGMSAEGCWGVAVRPYSFRESLKGWMN